MNIYCSSASGILNSFFDTILFFSVFLAEYHISGSGITGNFIFDVFTRDRQSTERIYGGALESETKNQKIHRF
jgi:hypothetical protein